MKIAPSLGVLAAVVGLLGVTVAYAQVDCSDPNNLCTGDPCVIPSLTVANPCTADFTPRTVVIAGTVRIRSGVSLTAGTIRVEGSIESRDSSGPLHVTLAATQDITVTGSIRFSPGPDTLTLSAGGSIDLAGIQLSTPRGYTTYFSAAAGGTLTVSGTIRANGSHVSLSGAQGVTVNAPIYAATMGGFDDGIVQLSSASGGVVINDTISVPNHRNVTITAVAGEVQVSAAGDVVVNKSIRGYGPDIGAYISLVSSGGDVTVNGRIMARREGHLTVQAAGVATLNRRVRVSGNFSNTMGFGGAIVRVEAPSVVIAPGATIAGDAPANAGQFCFKATGGDLLLGGGLFARGGTGSPGNIEASATGNLIAEGTFRVAPIGCIALTAGGTLDTSAGSFDTALSPDCPLNCM